MHSSPTPPPTLEVAHKVVIPPTIRVPLDPAPPRPAHPTAPAGQNPPVPPSPRVPNLETQETPLHIASRWYQNLRHYHSKHLRPLIRKTLEALQTSARTLANFDACGSAAWVYVHKTEGTIRVSANSCHHRHCQACSKKRAARISQNLQPMAEAAGRNLSLITFTLKHSHTTLRSQIDRLISSFRELRRLKLWTGNVTGAAWLLEVKIGKDGLWHPHLHCLAACSYIRGQQLSAAWLGITGDSMNVDIKRISADRGVSYITKYVAKPVGDDLINSPHLQEYIMAMKGVKVCAALGKWRKTKLSESQVKLVAAEWESVGALETIYANAVDGDPRMQRILFLLEKQCKRNKSPPSTAPTGYE